MKYNADVEAYHPASGKRYPLAGSHGHFFVPPAVEVVEDVLPDARRPQPGNRFTMQVPLLCYPVPASWYERREAPQPLYGGTTLLTASSDGVYPPGDLWPSQEVENSLTPEEKESFRTWKPIHHWYKRAAIDPQALEAIGWQRQYDITGVRMQTLLDDVVNLAESEAFTDQCSAQVAKFVRRYGPLWICRTSRHGICQLPSLDRWVWERDPCRWAPVEEIYAFWRFAWEVKAVLEIGQSLRHRQLARPSLYSHLRFCGESFAAHPILRYHQSYLAMEVSLHLNPRRGGLSLHMSWLDKEALFPTLQLSTMLGVQHAAWMQVAQVLCGAYCILQCDGCHAWYIRTDRRPQAGRKNFCSQCRGKTEEGTPRNLGSKRLAAARRREEERLKKAAILERYADKHP